MLLTPLTTYGLATKNDLKLVHKCEHTWNSLKKRVER